MLYITTRISCEVIYYEFGGGADLRLEIQQLVGSEYSRQENLEVKRRLRKAREGLLEGNVRSLGWETKETNPAQDDISLFHFQQQASTRSGTRDKFEKK